MLYQLSYGLVGPAGFEPATLKFDVVPSAFAAFGPFGRRRLAGRLTELPVAGDGFEPSTSCAKQVLYL